MYIEWKQQAQGFNQATYPCKNFNLSAHLMVSGDSSEQESTISLGSVTVEETADGSLSFLVWQPASLLAWSLQKTREY